MILILSLLTHLTFCQAQESNDLSFCRFGPKMLATAPVFNRKGDKCSGTAKVQGLMWKCGTIQDQLNLGKDYRKTLSQRGKEECQQHCQSRASNCEGIFRPPTKCAIEMEAEDALTAGKRLGCRKTCSDQYFVHCSIYNSGFISIDSKMMADQPPNCRCVQGEQSKSFLKKIIPFL